MQNKNEAKSDLKYKFSHKMTICSQSQHFSHKPKTVSAKDTYKMMKKKEMRFLKYNRQFSFLSLFHFFPFFSSPPLCLSKFVKIVYNHSCACTSCFSVIAAFSIVTQSSGFSHFLLNDSSGFPFLFLLLHNFHSVVLLHFFYHFMPSISCNVRFMLIYISYIHTIL